MPASEILLPVTDYDLAATLDSGQVFRWQRTGDSWHGVIGRHFVRLTPAPNAIHAATGVRIRALPVRSVKLPAQRAAEAG